MSVIVSVEYECGSVYDLPTAMRDDQTLLGNASLGDTLILQADAIHDATCPRCTPPDEGQR